MLLPQAMGAQVAPVRQPSLQCVQVVGDSMMPTVRDSDLAVTDPGHRRPLNDQLFALWAGGAWSSSACGAAVVTGSW